ncbi:hypothetical protein B0H19DRAFT_1071587 [Mycena capillaripes]|nr:hypothetical protein B0H19DRAFT_1071587 [Mycena capillaripes]
MLSRPQTRHQNKIREDPDDERDSGVNSGRGAERHNAVAEGYAVTDQYHFSAKRWQHGPYPYTKWDHLEGEGLEGLVELNTAEDEKRPGQAVYHRQPGTTAGAAVDVPHSPRQHPTINLAQSPLTACSILGRPQRRRRARIRGTSRPGAVPQPLFTGKHARTQHTPISKRSSWAKQRRLALMYHSPSVHLYAVATTFSVLPSLNLDFSPSSSV